MAEQGRPSIYTEDIANKICLRLANGESLKKISEDEKMPSRAIIHKWLLDDDKKYFLDKYKEAVNTRTENMFDELNEIADSVPADETNKARLRVDTRKWYLSKVMPKKYGDKLDVTSDNKPIPLLGGQSNGKDNTSDKETTEAE